jgi:hypothetical protein
MRRLALAAALALLAAGVISCGNMPTAPKAMVHLMGTVTDRNGAPIQAVYLDFLEVGPYPQPLPLYYPRTPGAIFVHAVTDLNGRYAADIPPGKYWLWIIAPSSTAYAPILVDKEVRAGDTRYDYRFRHVRLAIRPTLSGGQSPGDTYASARTDDYVIGSNARHAGDELEMFVPPGAYHVSVGAWGAGFGYPNQNFDVRVAADTTIDVAFGGSPVTAHLTGPGGSALPGYVYANSEASQASAETDANGTAVLYLPNGGYSMGAQAKDETIQSREIPYVPITGVASVDFNLDGTHWSGTLRRNSDGAPLAGVALTVRSIGTEGERAYGETDPNGAFHFVVRPNWGHTIAVESGYWGFFDDVVAGADSTFDLVIPDPPAGPWPAPREDPSRSRFIPSSLTFDKPRTLR